MDVAIEKVRKDMNLKFSLKNEQIEAIKSICIKKHTFCVLPTGFGKSEIFVFPPLVLKKVNISGILMS